MGGQDVSGRKLQINAPGHPFFVSEECGTETKTAANVAGR